MSTVWPRGAELLVAVHAPADGTTARCECGGPLVTPRPVGAFTGAVELDWLRCPRCHAHVVLRVTAPRP
jgi:hypothetical protein